MARVRLAQNAAPPPAAGRGAPPGFGRGPAHTGPVPALEFINRIQARSGAAWRPAGNDRLVAGDVTSEITGIACMALATLDGLKSAAAAGRNLVISLENCWWSDNDDLARLEGNATYRAKRDFIRAHNMVVMRLGDHIADMKPNPVAMGMAQALGWQDFAADRGNPVRFTIPPTTLEALAQKLGRDLDARTLRAVGDPKLQVGYTHEWEAVMYCQDQVAIGMKKGLVSLGEAAGEQDGMRYFADWLKTVIDEVPVDHVKLAEPYWNPDQPVNLISTKT